MHTPPTSPARRRPATLFGVLIIALGPLTPAFAQPGLKNGQPEQIPAPVRNGQPEQISGPLPALSLGDCIRTAMERQPTLQAYRASIASAEAGRCGLENQGRIANLLAPDLKYRREQAARGVGVAQAELMQAEYDAVYAVVRTYYSVVYARQQQAVADDIVRQLTLYLEQVRDIVKGGGTKRINKDTEDKLTIYRAQAVARQIEAVGGMDRAMAALREAMGVPCDYRFQVADRELPVLKADLSRDAVVEQALHRRGEITLASLGLEVFQIEVSAQGAVRFRRVVRTFASGSDPHSRTVPLTVYEPDYRPGGVGPEAPPNLAGDRNARVQRALALAQRAGSVLDKTRNLITLEAEVAHERWLEAARKVDEAKVANEAGKALAKRTREDTGGRISGEEQITNEVLAAQARAAYNDAVFQQLAQLANLERVTAGGVRVNYPGR